jgi:hypothetical protein
MVPGLKAGQGPVRNRKKMDVMKVAQVSTFHRLIGSVVPAIAIGTNGTWEDGRIFTSLN